MIKNIDSVLTMPLDTLLAVYFNTVVNNSNNFEVISSYRASKFLPLDSDSHLKTAEQLSNKYGLNFSLRGNSIIFSEINNNYGWTLDNFLNAIYESIIINLTRLPEDYPLDAEIALALFIFRGSVDFNRSLYAVDWKNPTKTYLNNFFKLLLSSDDLLSRLNLNFRELQPQFIAGANQRNTQIRVNLRWFYDHVILKYPYINKYKTNILVSNAEYLGESRTYPSFSERLIFYKQSVLGRSLTQPEIESLRKELDFSALDIANCPDNTFAIRNQKIVSFAREAFEDVCVGCQHLYDIADRSFKMARNDRYYFEIHHVIPFAHNQATVDVLDNLVKLCPICHRALAPGRAYPNHQKAIIEKILQSRSEVSAFVVSMMGQDYKSPVDYVYDLLK